ncbi:ubiquitin-like protein Pup [Ruania alkalisoli]|uniref:Prokaryotic ubiquitin-like protein Pup n=1 Tax=Ruania alkalisoli TaxID=2779775 RepID=A0A7M1SXK6_9MICO|nr:ubiquitin-like protein Pup [Ruania alkalisoli]QOR72310.1 ubiquitin-like protein Pup [Ruania alkalisoli]
MSPRQFDQRHPDPRPDDDQAPPPASSGAQSRDTEVDSLLEEIDDVLETNAESFVRGFVQKGGQ